MFACFCVNHVPRWNTKEIFITILRRCNDYFIISWIEQNAPNYCVLVMWKETTAVAQPKFSLFYRHWNSKFTKCFLENLKCRITYNGAGYLFRNRKLYKITQISLFSLTNLAQILHLEFDSFSKIFQIKIFIFGANFKNI